MVPHYDKPDKTGEDNTIIVSLMYMTVRIRPDIADATTFLAQFASQPGPEQWIAVQQVLPYVKGTLNFGLTYLLTTKPSIEVIGYADATYGSDISD